MRGSIRAVCNELIPQLPQSLTLGVAKLGVIRRLVLVICRERGLHTTILPLRVCGNRERGIVM